jgi:hypothetical protein
VTNVRELEAKGSKKNVVIDEKLSMLSVYQFVLIMGIEQSVSFPF